MFSRPTNERYHPAGLIFSTLGAILVLYICFKLKIRFPEVNPFSAKFVTGSSPRGCRRAAPVVFKITKTSDSGLISRGRCCETLTFPAGFVAAETLLLVDEALHLCGD